MTFSIAPTIFDAVYNDIWKVQPKYEGYVVANVDNLPFQMISIYNGKDRHILFCEDIHLIEYSIGDTLIATKWKE